MSSKEQKHEYHLVDPSPWPIYTSLSVLVLVTDQFIICIQKL